MPISIGTTTVTALFLGTTSITSAYLGNTLVFGGSFTPLDLFSTGSQGIWLDPSDLSTMFSDRAGTTAVTTPGTVVGLRLDKSKGLVLGTDTVVNGSFATDADWVKGVGWSIASGLLTSVTGSSASTYQPMNFNNGSWYRVTFTVARHVSGGVSISLIGASSGSAGTSFVSAVGTYTFLLQAPASTTGEKRVQISRGFTNVDIDLDNISVRELAGNHAVAPTDAARPTYGVEPKGGRRNLLLATDTLATQSLTVTAVAHTLAFTGTGTVTLSGASTAGPLVGTGAGNRVSLTFTPTAASLTLTVSGSVTLGQLEVGSSATAYQKVVTAYNVTESGVATCHYVQYDGSDDSMSTAAIDFSGTDKMSVFAGVRKLSDAAAGMVAELSANINSNNGAFHVTAPSGSTATYGFASKGTSGVFAAASGFVSPTTNVLTGFGDISGDNVTLRVDGTQVATSATDQGTGNFGNYPLFIGRRNNATLPFHGRDYGIVVVGKAASGTEITDTETWLAARTSGVSI